MGQARDGMAVRGLLPPLDPSTVLRVSGPSLGMDLRLRRTCSPIGGMDDGEGVGLG